VPVLSLRANEHSEATSLPGYAWRVRTYGGKLLLELDATPPPTDDDVALVHVFECE
jgi:hypothetical protein